MVFKSLLIESPCSWIYSGFSFQLITSLLFPCAVFWWIRSLHVLYFGLLSFTGIAVVGRSASLLLPACSSWRLYHLLHRVRLLLNSLPSLSRLICVSTSYLLVYTWRCLAGCVYPWSASPSHLKVSSVLQMIHPCCTLAAWFIKVGVTAWFRLFIAQLLGTDVSFIIYHLRNCCFIYFVLLSSLPLESKSCHCCSVPSWISQPRYI